MSDDLCKVLGNISNRIYPRKVTRGPTKHTFTSNEENRCFIVASARSGYCSPLSLFWSAAEAKLEVRFVEHTSEKVPCTNKR
jgi:hypothetical protein